MVNSKARSPAKLYSPLGARSEEEKKNSTYPLLARPTKALRQQKKKKNKMPACFQGYSSCNNLKGKLANAGVSLGSLQRYTAAAM